MISLSGVLPYLVVMLVSWRIGRSHGLKTRWWVFPLGWIGFAGHIAAIIAERLGYIPPGPISIYYSTLSRDVMAVIAAVGMTNILALIHEQPTLAIKLYLPVIAVAPATAAALHRNAGHALIIAEPIPTQILYQGFIFWMLLSYSALLLAIFERKTGVGHGLLATSASLLFGAVSFVFLYVASNYLYGVFSIDEYNTWRGTVPIVGTVAGIATLITSFNMGIRLTSPAAKTDVQGRLSTGVQAVDRDVGGIPFPASILIMGPASSGKTSIVNTLTVTRLREGDSVARLCLEYDAQSVRVALKNLGLEPAIYEKTGQLILVEGYLQLSGITPTEKFTTSWDLTDISINITKALNMLPTTRKWIILDSITGICDEAGVERVLRFIRTVAAKTTVAAAGLIVTINNKALSPIHLALIQELFNCVVETDVFEERGRLIRRMRILKIPGLVGEGKWKVMQR